MIRIDASDPGKAAMANFAAAWLFAQVSLMNAENMQRHACGNSMAYGEQSYVDAMVDAEHMLWHEPLDLPPVSLFTAADVQRAPGDGQSPGRALSVPAAPTGD